MSISPWSSYNKGLIFYNPLSAADVEYIIYMKLWSLPTAVTPDIKENYENFMKEL